MGKYDNMTLEQINQLITDTRVAAVRVQTELNAQRAQYTEKVNEVKALGINPDTLDADIAKLEKEISDLKESIMTDIPLDIVNQYKSN
jgi:diaminopimelate decarboxylase